MELQHMKILVVGHYFIHVKSLYFYCMPILKIKLGFFKNV